MENSAIPFTLFCFHRGNVKLSPRTYVVLYGLRKGCDMYEQFEPRLIRYVVHHPDFFAFTRRADLAFMISFKPLLIYNATEILPEAGSPSKDEPSSDKLFVSFEKVPVGTKCTFIGFLTENDTGMPLTRLTATSIEIENESLCEEAYTEKRKALYPDKYCAGGFNYFKDLVVENGIEN
ncbi:unnamed protein product [Hermetia illucens]|uniref:Uncharacterized protein n=1 Tax=Hermetia illucens TaxID=343691 RepID=A0A7R8YVF3_HERIL|nr:unnamed protein product [Hermetia illucens]